MKIFIIGAGFTGMQLARALVLERNNVILIDNDPERVRDASDQLDCTVLEADGNNLESLEAAGIASADALVTLTEDDEINMITCSLVEAVYPRIQTIARVRNYAYYKAAEVARRRAKSAMSEARPLYGIDNMLNPEVEAADAISAVFELITAINTAVRDGASSEFAKGCMDILMELCTVLGLLQQEIEETVEIEPEIQKLIDERQEARKAKNFARADEIRDQLKAQGITLKDTPQGVQIIRE